jgi:predicted ester cyclase
VTTQATTDLTEVAERWFTLGWQGELAMAQDIFSDQLTTNGKLVGVAGPVGRIKDRLRGFPDLSTTIEEMFQVDDTVVTRLVWRGTHTGPYGGVKPTRKPVEVADMAIWRFADGKVVENWTLQDHFGLLKQLGCLPEGWYAA